MMIVDAHTHEHLQMVRGLFEAYQNYLGIDLSFQGFDNELATLPGKYARPKGNLYVALHDGAPVGCVAFYPLEDKICELKRLFVAPKAQGLGLGKALMKRAIADARAVGYKEMRLDSLRRLQSAYGLYLHFGFAFCDPYNENPQPDVYYMCKQL